MSKELNWLKRSERRLTYEQAKRLLEYWQGVLGMGDYAFTMKLTKNKWEGRVGFFIGLHYGKIAFSTERGLVHELVEAMLLRYFKLKGSYELCSHADDDDNIEYLIRHILLFQLVNALLKLKYKVV